MNQSLPNTPANTPEGLRAFLDGRERVLRVFKSGPATQARLAQDLRDAGQSVVVVAPGAAEYRELTALLGLFTPSGGAETSMDPAVPSWERPWLLLPPHLPARPSREDWAKRWAALFGLLYARNPKGVLASAGNLLHLWPPPDVLAGRFVTIAKGDDVSQDMLMEQGADWGYVSSRLVSGPGEMVRRGDILDIHAPGYDLPLRMEFFGDTVESIRLFDPATQRSRAELAEVTLLPVAPCVTDTQALDAGLGHIKALRTSGELTAQAAQDLAERAGNGDGFFWPGLYYPDAAWLEAYLPGDAVFSISSGTQLRARLEDLHRSWRAFLDEDAERSGWRAPARLVVRPEEGARSAWRSRRQVVFEDLAVGRGQDGLDLAETRLTGFTALFWKPEQARRPWSALMEALAKWRRERFQVVLAFRSARARKKFLSMAEPEGLPMRLEYHPDEPGLYALVAPVRGGMDLSWRGVLVLGEDVMQPEKARISATGRASFQGLDTHDDLAEGDLLVHRDYGLSSFGGLTNMQVGDAVGDFLHLGFSGGDKLYLPVDRLNLVQRYKGPESAHPALDKLGGARWKTATSRARKAVEKIARDLVEMYAFRRVAKGYSYGAADDMYREFEATFGFEETPDQERAVREVLADMEREAPMDRLVCGDVGFGKTEVALRAAFRAVAEGRQVALLCPTTVLAEQHYQTFLSRMEGFPVRVGMLSRFVPPREQKAVVAATAKGEVDILIGTHRLLSKDVTLPRLGLLILDEEQRFGVKHKERLKKLKQNIDALTLTATPIPRTLQLSLSGLRGLSVIETPPEDRKPVQTDIVERDDAELRAVLNRELERGGQVFWVYNRVQGLERAAEYVQKLVPDARVGMAHGQMGERALEDSVHRFWRGETDVLVCTAIVESGLDFPNANTLVVDQAQMFGLGQLYQLRGRVGRSERQAYAYFIVPDVDGLPETARRRLRIILDMDYLGAGFKIAMEDLRLRGAGNILGEVQSGHVAKVGLDLFLEMLEEEVRRLRGSPMTQRTDPEVNFLFEARIPGGYVPDNRERLKYYKALAAAADDRALADLEAELRDRFGPAPEPVDNFLGVLALKLVLSRLQVLRADLAPSKVTLTFSEEARAVEPEALIAWVAQREDRARLLPPARLEVRYGSGGPLRRDLEALAEELGGLLDTEPDPTHNEAEATCED